MNADEGIVIFQPDGRHEAANGAVAGRQVVRNAGLVIDGQSSDIAAQRNEWYPFLAPWVDKRAPPCRLGGSARVGARETAQDAVHRRLDARIRGHPVALPGVERVLRDRIEVGVLAAQAGDVRLVREFATQEWVLLLVLVIDDRMHDR